MAPKPMLPQSRDRKMSVLTEGVAGTPTGSPLLFGRFSLLQRQRLGPRPGMLGNLEEHTLGAVVLDLEAAHAVPVLVHVMFAPQAFELLRAIVHILDLDAQMIQPC